MCKEDFLETVQTHYVLAASSGTVLLGKRTSNIVFLWDVDRNWLLVESEEFRRSAAKLQSVGNIPVQKVQASVIYFVYVDLCEGSTCRLHQVDSM